MTLPPERFFLDDALELARAIQRADLDAVRRLAPSVDLRARGAEDATLTIYAFHEALTREPARLAVLSAVVACDPESVQVRHPEAGTALELALVATSPVFITALLDGGVSPDVTLGDTGTPALCFAPRDVCVENLGVLLDRGAELEARDFRGSTALMRALYELQLDAVEYLLQRGADVRVIDRSGVSFLYALSRVIERQPDDSELRRRMEAVRDRYAWEGMWPPATPEVERERMRERGEVPIVPSGHSR